MHQSFAMPPESRAIVPHQARGSGGGRIAARFPVYQIDFTAVASGKVIATSKRRIRWRFGFSNRHALEAGDTGTACRGEEHDVTVVWSVTSGKRLILSDGQEVHYSTNRSATFEFSWTMRGNHVIKVICHAAPSLSATPGFRQYDMSVDGQSFFNMPKVYELGIRGQIQAHAPVPGVITREIREERPPPPRYANYDLAKGEYVKPPQTIEEEEADLQAAIRASLEESRAHFDRKDRDKPSPPALPASSPAPASEARSIAAAPPPAPTPPTASFNVPENLTLTSEAAKADEADLLDLLGGWSTAENISTPAPAIQPSPSYASQSQSSAGAIDYNASSLSFAQAPADMNGYSASYPTAQSPADAYNASFTTAQSTPNASYTTAPTGADSYNASFASAQSVPDAYNASYISGQASSNGMHAPNDPFAPQPVQDVSYQKSFNEVSYNIMNQYATSADQPQSTGQPISTSSQASVDQSSYGAVPTQTPTSAMPGEEGTFPISEESNQNKLSINTQYVHPEDEVAQPKTAVDKAMRKLVNFDDIGSPAESEVGLSMNKNIFAEEKKKSEIVKGKVKSKAIPPPGAGWGGPQPSLAEMRSVRPAPQKEVVMQPRNAYNPNAAQANAMVLHQQQRGNFGGYAQGPPPINQQTGFGAGAQAQNAGYGPPGTKQGYGVPQQQQYQQQVPQQQQFQQQVPQQQQQQQQPQFQQGYMGAPPPPPQQYRY